MNKSVDKNGKDAKNPFSVFSDVMEMLAKDPKLASLIKKDPVKGLKKLGIELDESVKYEVVIQTDEVFYFVIPYGFQAELTDDQLFEVTAAKKSKTNGSASTGSSASSVSTATTTISSISSAGCAGSIGSF